jgi:hypothetical protein
MVEPAQEQERNQRRPDLDPDRVFARAHERLDLQMLLDRLEVEFDLPTIPVNGGDGRGAKSASGLAPPTGPPVYGRACPSRVSPNRSLLSLLGPTIHCRGRTCTCKYVKG